VLVEATSPNFFDIVGAEFAAGRPFTDLENREGARAVVARTWRERSTAASAVGARS